MSRRVLGFVGALLLAIVGIGLLLAYVSSAEDRALEGEELVEVFVVADAIGQGTSASEIGDRVRLEQVPKKLRIDDAVVSLDEIDGLVSSIDLRPGEQITRSRFVLAQSLTGFEGPSSTFPTTSSN
ncbi:MAG: SAF domain-containing protein [Acidimicrobiales bacterium]